MNDEKSQIHNLVNLEPSDLDKAIYHFMPLRYLLEMLQKNTLPLQKITAWTDPYENFFFKSDFSCSAQIKKKIENLSRNIYGQCWTTFKNSDAMWRIYSPDCKSVRIKTTIRKLLAITSADDGCRADTYIGSIQYLSFKKRQEWLETHSCIEEKELRQTGIESLFIKRDYFSHEKEVRIIYSPQSEKDECHGEIKEYKIEAKNFIEEITFDSRLDATSMMWERKNIARVFGYPDKSINKSVLYRFKPIKIKVTRPLTSKK